MNPALIVEQSCEFVRIAKTLQVATVGLVMVSRDLAARRNNNSIISMTPSIICHKVQSTKQTDRHLKRTSARGVADPTFYNMQLYQEHHANHMTDPRNKLQLQSVSSLSVNILMPIV